MSRMQRRRTLRVITGTAAGSLMAGLGPAANAQSYPARPIRMIVPLAAGSAVDNGARVLTQRLGADLGQSFFIENLPGSSGLIGADRVAKAAPDGYTLGGFNDSVLTMVPNIMKAPWDPLADFTPVSLVGTIEWGLVVRHDSPFRSVGDFVAAARSRPARIDYGSGGNGSPQHLAMALFANRLGIEVNHVPYKGATPAAVAIAAGEVEVGFQGLGTVTSLITGGKLRLLAVATPQRLPQYPDVPTVVESGSSDFTFNSWFAVVAPKDTPRPIVDRLHGSIERSLADAETRRQLVALGITVRGTTPDAFAAALRQQFELYRDLIRRSGIRAD